MEPMKNRSYTRARTQGLVVRELADEIVIYDTERDKAHCLNPTAAFVWKHADGRRTPAEIAQLFAVESGAELDEKVVWYALGQLHQDNLLEEASDSASDLAASVTRERISRKNMLKLVGAAAAVPVVATVVSSPAYAAGSCNALCTVNTDCTSTYCGTCKGAGTGATTCQHTGK